MMTPAIRTLLPMAVDGYGPSHACTELLDGFEREGVDWDLLVNRVRLQKASPNIRSMLPGPLARLPHRMVSKPVSSMLEEWYLKRLRPGDVAWLWPSVSLRTQEKIAARGNPIVLEGINTRMAVAKQVLDAAYDALGAPPAHGITQERIDVEEQKLSSATTIFAPSPSVEEALNGSPLEGKFLSSSYGTETRNMPVPRQHSARETVTFLFCGYVCVRKGIHHLLDIWPQMPKNARLRIVGKTEPLIAESYADVLNSENIETFDFTLDLDRHYQESDVFLFPSLEEGDPLVTYMAGVHGLPIVASPVGAGRMGVETGAADLISPPDGETVIAALIRLFDSVDLRKAQGEKTRSHIEHYDWRAVGARRARTLNDTFLASA